MTHWLLRRSSLIAILGIALLGSTMRTEAQGFFIPERPIPIGRPIPIYPIYVKNIHVRTHIKEAIAETTVEQTLVNESGIEQEGTYLYPLPEGATPTAFSMTVGDKTMEPRILHKDEARGIYESIVRRRRDPALLEYVGRDLVRVSVYPIPAHGERLIRMRYTEILKPDNGMRKYAYPLSTSRFASRPVGTMTVDLKIETNSALKNVYSPSHNVSIRRPDERTATLSWEGQNIADDSDLRIFFSTSDDEIGLSLLTYRTGDEGGYFMLLASPRVTIPKNRVIPKQVVFVLDRTGSMSGEKIVQARKSMLFCLNSLHPEDRFSVITFNESPDLFSRKLEPATAENIQKARKFVEGVEASGGTNIDEALRAGLKLLENERGRQKMVVFMTDGLATVGETNVETILQHVRQQNGTLNLAQGEGVRPVGLRESDGAGARIFCFGVGYDVNVPFLDRLGQQNKGDSDFVKPAEDIEVKVSSFFSKVSSPILSNLQVNFEGAEVYDVFPKTYPDLFKGSQLVITGRFRGDGRGLVRLSGLANDTKESFKLATNFGGEDNRNAFLPRVWAMRKIGWLVDQVRLSNQPEGKKEVLDEIIRLSQTYGIITEYTSFLVDEREGIRLGYRDSGGNMRQLSEEDRLNVRKEVAQRAFQFGAQGKDATNQSLRAKIYNNNDKMIARGQTNSVQEYFYDADGSLPSASVGRFSRAGGAGGGTGGYSRLGAGRAGSPGAMMGGMAKQRGGQGVMGGVNFGLPANSGNEVGAQAVAGKTFYLQKNNQWQDHAYDAKKQKLVSIRAFSDAHFALIRAVPKLSDYSTVGSDVIVTLGKNAVLITEAGKDAKEKLTESEIRDLTAK
ncbi:MAG: VIT domain-containing protein [Armatimonadetes bacterium]|nr:VIT domain-containing protein [Armatimonadota bacterium]